MNAPSVDIATLLSDNGFGQFAVIIFAMERDSAADEQITVLDTGGLDEELKNLVESPTIQILTQGDQAEDSALVYARARAVHEFLIQLDSVTINNTCYTEFEIGNPPLSIGRDENDRAVYSANYILMRNPT